MIYLEGHFVKPDPERAIDHYIRGAAKNNAYCFFELSRLHMEGEHVEKDSYLEALYLKRSAEEGLVVAQHMLGIAYHEGRLFKRNDLRALAWFRESVRNGNATSYLNCGELLLHGDEKQPGFKRNKLFAFVNFLGAYSNGAFFIGDKLKGLAEEIEQEMGIRLPKIVYVDEETF